jgi:DNA-binding NarL/FixJ family response regulator
VSWTFSGRWPRGKTSAGIEQVLFLSESTVEKHVNAIFTKLGISAAPVRRRVVAVLAFLENAPAYPVP